MSPRDMLTERQANVALTPSHLLESITEPPMGSVAYKVRALLHKKAKERGEAKPNTIIPPSSEWKLEDMV